MPNIFDLKEAKHRTDELGHDEGLVSHDSTIVDAWGLAIKRAIDIAVSASAIILLSPVMVLTAALVKLTAPGPIFFIQKRLGRNKRMFNIYKFRTMVVDAEKRLVALKAIRKSKNFEPLAVSFKRVRKILEKADMGKSEGRRVQVELFDHDAERELYAAMREAAARVQTAKRGGRYQERGGCHWDDQFGDRADQRHLQHHRDCGGTKCPATFRKRRAERAKSQRTLRE